MIEDMVKSENGPRVVSDRVKGIYPILEAKHDALIKRAERYKSDPLHDMDLPPETKKVIYERVVRPSESRWHSRITSNLNQRLEKIKNYLDSFVERNGRFVGSDNGKDH